MAKELENQIELFLDQIAQLVASKAREIAPVDIGRLRENTKVLEKSKGSRVVGTSKAIYYAKWIYYGTGIYGPKKRKIRPKKAKALKTPYGYKKSVKGIKPNPYLEEALRMVVRNGGFSRAAQRLNLSEAVYKELGLDKFEREWGS